MVKMQSETSHIDVRGKAPTNATHAGTIEAVFLHIAKVRLYEVGNNYSVFARILFETASHHSYITEDTAAKLRLKPLRRHWMSVKIFGKQECELQELNVVQFRVRNITDNIYVYVETFCVPIIRGNSGPVALNSTLGWILGGGDTILNGNQSNCIVAHMLSVSSVNDKAYDSEDDIREEIQKFWTVDAVGLKSEDDCVTRDFGNYIKFNGDRYVIKLPFKPDHDNFAVSKNRLAPLIKRLRNESDKQIMKDYTKI